MAVQLARKEVDSMTQEVLVNILERLTALEKALKTTNKDCLTSVADTNSNTYKNIADITDTQNAACELSEEVDSRITDVELALCELSQLN